MATTDIGRAVPLLRGEYDPAQTYELNDIVSLNGSLYWHYSHEVTTNVAPQATSTWKIVLSLTDAEAYIARAETAAEEAESAKDDAVTAKTAAETASAAATGASEAATAAKDDAVTARNAAQTAETGAVEAKNAAVSAKEAAQSAASSAGTSATNAGNSAGTAEYYAENAGTAAETATTKASEASASAATASSAATTATEAKNTAVSSASTATTKAGEASTSATSAASSAAAAQAVKDSIPEDYSALSEDVSELKTQLNDVDDIAYQKITATPETGYTDKILNNSGYVGNAAGYNTSEAIDVDGFNAVSLNYSLKVDNIGSGIWRAAMFFTSTTMGTGIVSDFGAVQENDKIIVPNGAKYLRISYLSATTPAVTKYKGNRIASNAVLNDNVAQFRDHNNDNIFSLDLNDLSIAVNMLKFAHYQNIVDSEENTPNKYLVQATGALSGSDNATYFTTDFIEVNPGDVLYSFTQMRFIAGYATASTADYDSDSWSGQNTYSYTVPNGIKYVRITGYTANVNIFTVLKNSIPDGYIPHTYKIDNQYIEPNAKRNYYNAQKDTMTANDYLLIDKKMPVKNDVIIQFSGNISGSFSGIEFGFTDNISAEDTTHFKIDATKFYRVTNNPYEVEHGLTLSGNVAISIKQTFTHLDIDIECNGEKYHSSNGWSPINKKPYVKVLSGMTDCIFSWTTLKNGKNIVIFGDSYTSYGENRWVYYLEENEYADNVVISGFPGEQSADGFENFENLMAVSSAKYIVWAYGMNDLDGDDTVNAIWKDRIDKVIKYCEDNNITPVLCTIPNVPTRSNVLKNNYVRSFIGTYPVIDFAKAVGSDISDTWFDGMLEPLDPPTVTERVHPTVIGAKALYNRAIADFPQLCVSD